MAKTGINQTSKELPVPSRLPTIDELLECKGSAPEALVRLLNCLIESKRLPEACATTGVLRVTARVSGSARHYRQYFEFSSEKSGSSRS
jgi:hypothetical protein